MHIDLIVEYFIPIVESSLVLRQPAMENPWSRVHLSKFFLHAGEGNKFSSADGCEVSRMAEKNHPFFLYSLQEN